MPISNPKIRKKYLKQLKENTKKPEIENTPIKKIKTLEELKAVLEHNINNTLTSIDLSAKLLIIKKIKPETNNIITKICHQISKRLKNIDKNQNLTIKEIKRSALGICNDIIEKNKTIDEQIQKLKNDPEIKNNTKYAECLEIMEKNEKRNKKFINKIINWSSSNDNKN